MREVARFHVFIANFEPVYIWKKLSATPLVLVTGRPPHSGRLAVEEQFTVLSEDGACGFFQSVADCRYGILTD